MVQHRSQTEGGGTEALWKSFFLVTRQRPATSTFCTYCGDWVECTSNAINKYHDTYRIVTQVSRYVSHREIRYRRGRISSKIYLSDGQVDLQNHFSVMKSTCPTQQNHKNERLFNVAP